MSLHYVNLGFVGFDFVIIVCVHNVSRSWCVNLNEV